MLNNLYFRVRFLRNELRYFISGVKTGIKNSFAWFPIIWRDRDHDWAFLCEMMEFKLERMARCISDHQHHESSERDGENMRKCASILNRLRNDDYKYDQESRRYIGQEEDKRSLGLILSTHLTEWWD